MTKKRVTDVLTQQFKAATVSATTDSSPEIEVVDDDPTLVMKTVDMDEAIAQCKRASSRSMRVARDCARRGK